MTLEPGPDSIEEQVLSGANPSLRLLAAAGLVPLPPERLVALQVRLAQANEGEVSERARKALEETDARVLAPVLARAAGSETLEYFGKSSEHGLILETILRRKDVRPSLLAAMAGRVNGELQEVLILRQDAILVEPGILDALEANPDLRASVRRRIGEYRDHLLPKERPTSQDEAEPEEDVDATREEVEVAVETARAEPDHGEVDDETGLSEGQIRTLPVPVRLQLSRGASKTLRDILIRDPNPQVAAAVLKFNSFSEGEIERIAKMRTVAEDVLDSIGRSRRWMRKYSVAVALVKNPRTPIPLAVGLVPRLAVRDLRLLRTDRNVSEAVRTRANRLFMQKIQ